MISALLVILGIIGMELFVVLFHRYVMHGFLWRIHITHHRPTEHPLELNDVFVVFFMSISLSLMWFGYPIGWPFWMGVGVAIYGTAYFVMHDMIIHKRFMRQPFPRAATCRPYGACIWPIISMLIIASARPTECSSLRPDTGSPSSVDASEHTRRCDVQGPC